MSAANLSTIFNNHFTEFLEDIQSVFPEDVDIQTAKNSLIAIRKANPRLLIKIWNSYIAKPYSQQIDEGNIDFFITKDYSHDLMQNDYSNKIMEGIDRLRDPIRQMGTENRQKTMKYIQNLSKLASTYDSLNV
jgi:hypothetical protein